MPRPKDEPKPDDKSDEPQEASAWSDDQQKHQYYYDDAHGYESYSPCDDEDEADPEAEDSRSNGT